MPSLAAKQPVAEDPATSVPDLETVHAQLLAEMLQRFHRARLRVTGTSMLPALWPGDVLDIVSADVAGLRALDLVLVQREGRLFCHRFLGLAHDSARVRTRGDALHREDPPVAPDAVLGRVSAVHLSPRPPAWIAFPVCRAARFWPRPLAWMLRWRDRRYSLHPPRSE